MTAPADYDDFVARELTDHPTSTEVGATLTDLRAHRRALQALCDDAKNCRASEPDPEVANQMEESVQNITGTLLQLEKAIPALEKVQSNLAQYPAVVERMKGIVASVRAGRGTTS
jgi:hypothetical protein